MLETTLLQQSEANPYSDEHLGVLQDYFEERGDDRAGVVRMARTMNRIILPYAEALGVPNYACSPPLPAPDGLIDDDVLDVFNRLQRNSRLDFEDGVKTVTLATAATVRAACEVMCRRTLTSLQIVEQLTVNAPVRIMSAFSQWTLSDVPEDVMYECALTASRGDQVLSRGVVRMVRSLAPGQWIDVVAEPPGHQVYTYRFSTGEVIPEQQTSGEGNQMTSVSAGSSHRIHVFGESEESIQRLVLLVKATVSGTQSGMTHGVVPGGGVAWLRGALCCADDNEADWPFGPALEPLALPLLVRGFSSPLQALVSPLAFTKGVDVPFTWPRNEAERARAGLMGNGDHGFPTSNGLFREQEMRSFNSDDQGGHVGHAGHAGHSGAIDWTLRDPAEMVKDNVVAALNAASSLVGQCCATK